MPDQDTPSFSLTSTFIPTTEGASGDRNVLTGFLAADADAGSEAGAPAEGYGQLRLLQIRNDETVPGPGQVQNDFNADPAINQELNVLRLGESSTINGNLLTLPIGGGLLYVQPVYIQSTGSTQFPLLQRVLVAFGNDVGFGETLDEALDDVFGGDAGADAPDADAEDVTDTGDRGAPRTSGSRRTRRAPSRARSPSTDPQPSGEPTACRPSTRTSAQAAARRRPAVTPGRRSPTRQAALADNDFAAYGEAQERLTAAIERAIAAEEALGG